MKTLIFEFKNVYGKEMIYPVNNEAKLAVSLRSLHSNSRIRVNS
jgi:hypothetical protein